MRKFIAFMGMLCLTTGVLQAQIITDIPSDNGNTRFLGELFAGMQRPGLTIVGFNNEGNNEFGLGLKQILNEAYAPGNNEIEETLLKILDISKEPIVFNPPSNNIIETNSNILQYKAFEALASYVLEHNGIDSVTSNSIYGIPIRRHSTVMAEINQIFNYLLNNGLELTTDRGDYVKDVKSYANIARFIDLYLGLENAYKEWDYAEWNDPNSTVLPSKQEKIALLRAFYDDILDFYENRLNKGHGLGVQEDEVEAGNRPLKGHLAMGYSILAMQVKSYDPAVSPPPYIDSWVLGPIFGEAKTRAGDYSGGNGDRFYYWTYQTNKGSRYWAEGPYYLNYALPDAIQFWHAMRANNQLSGYSDPSDPFKNDWFLNPVEWLADISTPDGYIPPIDDGNKFPIKAANLLRWSNDYGSSEIGKKFNTVYKNILQYRPNASFPNNLYLLNLAIPKRPLSSSMPLPSAVSEQQLMVKTQDASGKTHYILLNTESGNAILRGEGHEQPDQLQLIYYVNEHSYLSDAGYDRGYPNENSFRNEYRYHNTMQYFDS